MSVLFKTCISKIFHSICDASEYFILLLLKSIHFFPRIEPMRSPKSLKISEIYARHLAIELDSLGYNVTRCHTFNITVCYHYFVGHNESKARCMEMDQKSSRHIIRNLPPYTNINIKMILTNPEGRKESEEVIIQTDEDGKYYDLHRLS